MTISSERRKKVFDMDGNRCLECGSKENLTIDHIKPKSKGGTDRSSNLQTLCRSCNMAKAAMIKEGHNRKMYERYVAIKGGKIDNLLPCVPVDSIAAKVTSQAGCDDNFLMNNIEILRGQKDVLDKRIAQLKDKLGIRNYRHWKNIRYRLNIHQQVLQWRDQRSRDTFEELVNLCDSQRRISDELEKYRKARANINQQQANEIGIK